ncbi:MAG: Zn-dependent protease [Limisphaerales bacterium]|jgi:Zn-dependent protease
MISLLSQGQFAIFALLIVALVLSLSFHEFGHAVVAKWQGDDTAQRAGRLTLNPLAHIDPMGLLMVVLVGFGYAKPVPTDPRNFKSFFSDLWVSAAGPFMNLILAFVSWNTYLILLSNGWESEAAALFFTVLVRVNLLLMLFNLIPLGPLDGHYILPYFLPKRLSHSYRQLNARYGTAVFLGLIMLSYFGNLPLFKWLSSLSQAMLEIITVVGV